MRLVRSLSCCREFIVAVLLHLPLLFLLAISPQNPDGAEMVTTALYGGVMHPSGMPLQAWLNLAFVNLIENQACLSLSLLSWVASILTAFILLLTLRQLRVGFTAAVLAVAFYICIPEVLAMAIQPEKYAVLALTTALFLYTLARNLMSPVTSLNLFAAALSFALVLSQHSAAVVFLPALIPLLLRAFWDLPRKQFFLTLAGGTAISVGVSFGFYASLLWLRAEQPWVDWGQLESLHDVWNHFIRKDYSITGLYNAQIPSDSPVISGLDILLRGPGLPAFVLGLPAGTWYLYKLNRNTLAATALSLFAALWLLYVAKLPSRDLDTATGYVQRYPCLAWPMLVLFYAGAAQLLLSTKYRVASVIALVAGITYTGYRGYSYNSATPNNIVDIYRQEVSREIVGDVLFISPSDFELFYGFPCYSGVCFPYKNLMGMQWYREKVAPRLDPKIPILLRNYKGTSWDFMAFLHQAWEQGVTIASTTASPFFGDQEMLSKARHVGVVWIFNKENKYLYTEEIINNTIRICGELKNATMGLPLEGHQFAREFLEKLHFAFKGAADALARADKVPQSELALKVATSLTPGNSKDAWLEACHAYVNETR